VVVGDEVDGGRLVERSSSSGWRPELEEVGGRRLERMAAGGSRGRRRLADLEEARGWRPADLEEANAWLLS
jgi:hypothetical protein